MDNDKLKKILKGTAYTGGGIISALAVNRLLGNKSTASNITSALLGAGLGGAATYLDNTNKDFSNNTVQDAIDDMVASKSSDVSSLTTPFTAPLQMFFGSKYTEKDRANMRDKIYNLKDNLSKGTAEQRAKIKSMIAELEADEALGERKTDATWTVVGGTTGGVGGLLGGLKVNDKLQAAHNNKITQVRELADKLISTQNAKANPASMQAQYNKLRELLPIGRKQPLISGNTVLEKLISLKQLPKNIQTNYARKRNVKLLHKARGVIKDLGGKSSSKAVASSADNLRDLVNLLGRKKLNSVLRQGKRFGKWGLATTALVSAGLLGGSYLASALSGYKHSRDRYIDAKNNI